MASMHSTRLAYAFEFALVTVMLRWRGIDASSATGGGMAELRQTDPPTRVSTPFGVYHASCTFEWPNGTRIGPTNATLPNGTVVVIPPCPYAHLAQGSYHGWVASAWAFPPSSDSEFTYFSSKFNVPSDPVGTEGTQDMTYIFNGLENPGGTFILQPVLQYSNYFYGQGCAPSQKGKWSFRGFAVGHGNVHCGGEVRVSAGDEIAGVMKMLSPGSWEIWAGKDGESGFAYELSGVEPQTSAQVALELVTEQCEAYPRGPIVFSHMLLQTKSGTMTPHWQPKYDPRAAHCGQHVAVGGSAKVVISEDRSQVNHIIM